MAISPEEYAEYAQQMGLAGGAAANLQGILEQLSAAQRATAAATSAASAATSASANALTSAAATAAAAGAKLDAAGRIRGADGRFLKVGSEAHAAAAEALGLGKATETAAEATDGAAGIAEKAAAKVGLLGRTMAAMRAGAESLSGKIGTWLSELDPVEVTTVAVKKLAEGLLYLSQTAIEATQAKDALRETFNVFTAGGGQALLDGIERMSASLPFTADAMNEWAKTLLSAGIQGEALETSLRAVASAQAIMGANGGAAAEGLIARFAQMAETGQKVTLDRRILAQLKAAGVTAEALAEQLGVPVDKLGKMSIAADKLGDAMQTALISKGGKALAVLGDSLPAIQAKLVEGWGDLFEDMGEEVGPFMSQVRGLASEFFAGSIAGGTMKDTLKAVLTPAFEIATRTVRAMHIAVLEIEIAYLKASIALRPLTSALDKIGVSAGVVNVAMYLIAGTAITLAVVLGVLAVAAALIALPFILTGLAIYGIGRGIQYLYGVIAGAVAHFDWLKATISGWVGDAIGALGDLATGAATAAADFVMGLVNGISSGAAAVVNAVKGLAAGALAGFTGPLVIKSPSRVLWKHGKDDVAGAVAGGVREGTDNVTDAMGGLTATPKGKGGARGGAGGLTVHFNNCVFGGGMTQEIFEDMMDAWWEKARAAGPEKEAAA